MDNQWIKRRKRLFEIIEVGNDLDRISRSYDFINVLAIILNLSASILYTFADIMEKYDVWILMVEEITVAFFAIDYVLRIWTARFLYPGKREIRSIKKYVFSFTGIVDLLSFLPYYLPIFFPAGAVAFRMLRIVRIFRLFRINAYYDSLNVITEVIRGKKQQLFSSVFIILVLMLASSLCMYSLEHEVQPEVFSNAFSGIWWSASTLLTVGYGDIYPVTTLGKVFGIVITFLGVGMVAIPTGIISAGFVDQYTSLKQRIAEGYQLDMQFIKIHLLPEDPWVGKRIADLDLPRDVIISVIKRDNQMILPHGDLVLLEEDRIVLGAEPFKDHERIKLKEVVLEEENPWTGRRIKELDIPRTSIVVLVKRGEKSLVPHGELMLEDDDKVFIYTQLRLAKTKEIEL